MPSRYGLFLTFLLLALPTASVADRLPQSERDLPIFPAAIRDMPLESQLGAAEPERPAAPGWEPGGKRSSAHLAFTTGMPAEVVLKFYLQIFGVPLRDGGPSPPLERLSFHEGDSFADCYDLKGQRFSAGDKARAELERKRKPLRPGKWIAGAVFSWAVQEANGDFSELTLQIRDASFACRQENSNGRRIETEIRFSRITWYNP